ncbi:MAG: hypothetical protein JO218_07810, partial [Burkholderiales bacterium]|nr:hypothetical protein [Burkholderiales bacterium]
MKPVRSVIKQYLQRPWVVLLLAFSLPAIADTPTQAQAARFLTQATFGPRQADINQVVSGG